MTAAPDAPAILCEGTQTSYRELEVRSARLGAVLRHKGVRPDRTVAVVADRGAPQIVGFVAVLRAGGAYVPIKPDLPAERVAWMIDETEPVVELCDGPPPPVLARYSATLIRLDEPEPWPDVPAPAPPRVPHDALAYIIYTSGSTGRPKGVMVTRRAFDAQLRWMQAEYPIDASDRVLQLASAMFDVSVVEIFWPLMVGRAVIVPRKGGEMEPAYLGQLADHHAATVVDFAPSLLHVVVDTCTDTPWRTIKLVFCGGEALAIGLARASRTVFPNAELHNQYGPTETTINATSWHCRPDDATVPIGRPVANTTAYVLDEELAPVPPGGTGELWLGGVQLARGYLRRPALTAERFRPDPFAARAGERIYRTGDVVRQRDDGVLEYVGRSDFQVKVRGFRIELGEIETVLRQHPQIRSVLVVARDDPANRKILVAYVCLSDPAATGELRDFVAERLPTYMVPSAFVVLDELPLTPTGKIDRNALAPPAEVTRQATELVAPRTTTEQALAGIWREVLGVGQVSLDDDFLALGGDSLAAARVIHRVNRRFHIELRVAALLQGASLRELARAVDEAPRREGLVPRSVRRTGELMPLSSTQDGIWLHERLWPGVYHLLGQVSLRGPLDVDRLRSALRAIVERHDALRTVFVERDRVPHARVMPAPDEVLTVVRATGPHVLAACLATARRHRFEGAAGPLFHFVLAALGEDHHVLVVNVHHLAWDALSQGVFMTELAGAYAAGPSALPPLGVQHADLVERERAILANDARRAELLDYWRGALTGAPAPLELTTDRPRTEARHHTAWTHTSTLPAELVRRLRAICAAEGTTLFSGVVGLCQVLLGCYADQDDVIVGTAVSSRHDEAAERLIGCLVNTVPLRLRTGGDPRLAELLHRARDMMAGALAHQDLPFSEMVRDLVPERAPGQSPWFDVTFNLYAAMPAADALGLTMQWDDVETGISAFDLSVSVTEVVGGALDVRIQYDTDRFDAGWIEAFARRYRSILEAAAASPQARLSRITAAVTHEIDAARIAPVLGMRPDELGRIARLTPPQRDLYLGYARFEALRRYLVHSLELGTVDASRWERALAFVTQHCELLRCRVALRTGQLHQVVCGGLVFEQAHTESLAGFVRDTAKVTYDIERDPLVRHWLVRDRDGRDWAVLAWSHVLFDARSATLLFQRVTDVYHQLVRGDEPHLAGTASFLEIADDLARGFDDPATLAFWRGELGAIERLDPLEAKAPAATTCARHCVLEGAVLERARALCTALGTSEAALYRGLFAAVLDGLYPGTEDFVLYDIRGGRSAEHRDVLGSFHTVLPRVISRAAIGRSFAAVLDQQRDVRRRTAAHPCLSVPAQRQLLNDTFQIYYNFYDFVALDGPRGPASVDTYDSFAEREVHLVVEASPARVTLGLHFDEHVLSDHRCLDRMRLLLDRLCGGEHDLGRIELVLPDELPILEVPNAAGRPVPVVETAVDAFERQVAARPAAVAIRFEGRQLSYGTLNERANRLAHHLATRGLGREDRIAICLERGLGLLVAIVGVLKAGCAYVPVDPEVPADRIRHLLEDSGVALLIDSSSSQVGGGSRLERLHLDELDLSAQPADNPRRAIAAGDLAYIIYTSGSTGLPNGVMVEHGNLIRLFQATERWFAFTAHDVWTLFHSCAFDFSVWEIFGALLHGGQLVVVPQLCARSTEDFYRLLVEEHVTVLNQTPSAFRQLVLVDQREQAELPALRCVIFGGEAMDFAAAAPWLARHRAPRLVNMYGITETTVHVTYRPLAPAEAVTGQPSLLGVALPDLQIYVLDHRGRRMPPGLPGEIHVAGAGVARGYHARPALTRQRFVTSRFGRLYRSGDVARVEPSGDVQYLGRADMQVKIRGYRIELGEIEAALRAHPGVQDAVVLAARDPLGELRLCAYAVVAMLPGPPLAELHAHLARQLPAYMIPSMFVNLDRLPLTANGKLDRAALPVPAIRRVEAGPHDEPRSDVERRLCEIWCDVLQLDRVGIHDSFFALGGHSMLALALVDRIRSGFGIRMPLRAVFADPTVAALAAVITEQISTGHEVGADASPREAIATRTAAIASDPTADFAPSIWQNLLWQSLQRDPCNAFLTVDAGLVLHGRLDIPALARSLDLIVARQASLRLRFFERAGALRASVAEPTGGHLLVSAVDDPRDPRAAAIEACTRLVAEPFDLAAGPLFRAAVVRFGEHAHVFGFAASHIVTDGSSLGVLFSELAAFYDALVETGSAERAEVPPITIQFADHLRSHQELIDGPEGSRQRSYWREALRDIEIARLPGEPQAVARQALTFHEGSTVRATISPDLTRRVRRLAEDERVTVYVMLCAAVVASLRASSAQDRFCVASASSQRHPPGVQQLIGFFANPVFVIADFRGVATWRELVHRMANAAFDAYEHPDVPIATELAAGLTRFNFNYINVSRLRPRTLAGLTVEPIELSNRGRRLRAYNDMILWLVEDAEHVQLELFYRVDLFTVPIIEGFLAQILRTLDDMTAAPDAPLSISRRAASTPGS